MLEQFCKGSQQHHWRQAWTEWLSNAKAVLTMEPWFGTTRAGGAITLDEIKNLCEESAGNLEAAQKAIEEIANKIAKQPRAGDIDQTKTSSPSTEKELGVIRVASGFEELYRRFTATPGNTLSLQARLGANWRKTYDWAQSVLGPAPR